MVSRASTKPVLMPLTRALRGNVGSVRGLHSKGDFFCGSSEPPSVEEGVTLGGSVLGLVAEVLGRSVWLSEGEEGFSIDEEGCLIKA